ncbi:preQ(1) synthase [candidate division NPL-UPA2 bacterium]|nr:preQ(1) synthase [candidate division NPL-UPA2 bacterium]
MPAQKRVEGLTILGRKKKGFPRSPEKATLETFQNPYPEREYWITFHCPEFTSLCPVTGQPDFGVIKIRYIPNRRCIEAKSLKLYLFSFRNVAIFNEEAANKILDDLVKACRPKKAEIIGEFNPRGGIHITVQATYPHSESTGR